MRSDVRSSVRLPGGFVCFGLGRVGMLWVTVGGRVWCLRGGSVQFGPEAYVRFVAKTRSSGGNGLFLLFALIVFVGGLYRLVLKNALPACVLAISVVLRLLVVDV